MNLNKFLISALALVTTTGAFAVPPIPGYIDARQPDGTEIRLSLRGDEHFSWGVGANGDTLVRNDRGFWTKATASTVKSMRKAARKAARNVQIDNSFPTRGKHNLLLLLVNFADTDPTYTPADFEAMMNSKNYGGIGSFRDYFLENSYGQLDVTTTVTPWINLPNGKAYYNIDNVPEMIYTALQKLSGIDLKQFDNDGDGVIDGIALIHQGTGQEASGNGIDIWSHSSVVYGLSVGGLQLGRYTCEPEILATTGKMQTMGVIVHEFGHNLGAPDFYDTDYNTNGNFPGTGVWDLLGSGAWNGNNGDRPAGINMWQKIQYGWVTPTLLNADTLVRDMPGSTFSPVAYRMNTTVPGEYFIIENRRREGNFDSALPGNGLLIYHADEEIISNKILPNEINARYPQGMYTVCSNGGKMVPDNDPASYGNIDDAPFPGKKGTSVFNDTSTPSTRSTSGRYAYRGLRNISLNNDATANFDFYLDEAPTAPTEFAAKAWRGDVEISWNMPDGTQWKRFNLYRNNVLIAQTENKSFVDRSPSGSRLVYDVDVVTPDGLVSPYVSTVIRIPQNKISSVSSATYGNRVTLNWKLSDRLTRMENDYSGETFGISEHGTTKGDFAHRFTVDDLRAYTGLKIRKIGFLPYLGPQQATYTIKVWEADENGSNPVVVSERTVKEYGANVWNSVLLTKTVEIKPGREYWVGYSIETKGGHVQVLGDTNTPLDGFGNLMRLNDGEWETDFWIQGTYYIYAELSDVKHTAGAPVENFADADLDPDADLMFPIGFAVYRDGTHLGNTSSRCFVENNTPLGSHTYSVASLYKGDNESSVTDTKVDVVSTAIDYVDSTTATLSVSSAEGQLTIAGACGTLTVTDTMGRTIHAAPATGEIITLSLLPGIYVVKADNGTLKHAVK